MTYAVIALFLIARSFSSTKALTDEIDQWPAACQQEAKLNGCISGDRGTRSTTS